MLIVDVEKEIYRLEINGELILSILVECPDWSKPQLDPDMLRGILARSIARWHHVHEQAA